MILLGKKSIKTVDRLFLCCNFGRTGVKRKYRVERKNKRYREMNGLLLVQLDKEDEQVDY